MHLDSLGDEEAGHINVCARGLGDIGNVGGGNNGSIPRNCAGLSPASPHRLPQQAVSDSIHGLPCPFPEEGVSLEGMAE